MPNEHMNQKSNRLVDEKSPYLLQHAYNPVDWFAWSEEAFAKAKAEDKPIFLSIGYSTCHWCHVMERESFEDDEAAEVLNKYFVSIKVDREERPDIDSIYMSVCQALTGSGGWPLTILMTPDKKPFYAGTYFPKNSKYGRPGLIEMLHSVEDAWKNKRQDLIDSSDEITRAVEKSASTGRKSKLSKATLEQAYEEYRGSFDPVFGGIGKAPKFPIPHNLLFLLRYYYSFGEKEALDIVEKTLESMYKGGIFDHVGYGFSRYSVDRKWLVPHFEKMLYDNSLLAMAYVETYQATKKEFYKEAAEKIFTYILRDMTSPEGGFYSAEDADSEGEEGKFYVWDIDEILEVLGEEDGKLYCAYYDITGHGNFEHKNIPNLIAQELEEIENNKELKDKLNKLRAKLFEYREKRVHPYKDDKILTAWNGFMIAALAYGGRVFNNNTYTEAAERAVHFIYDKLIDEKGRLLARYRDGEAAYLAYLEDYAFLTWALIELYENSFNTEYLNKALDLNKAMIEHFYDEKDGGFYLYSKDTEQLIIRPKEAYDGAIPSGNSVATLNMIRLSRITGDEKLEEMAQRQLEVFSGSIASIPSSHSVFLMAVLYSQIGGKSVVIVGDKEDTSAKAMLAEINNRYLPFTTTALNINAEQYKLVDNKSAAYICQNYSCSQPVTEIQELISLLDYK
jgi:uncharacterized protein